MITFFDNGKIDKKILAIGIGNAGYNVTEKIINYGPPGVGTYFIDSDRSTLSMSRAEETLYVPNILIKESIAKKDSYVAGKELMKTLNFFVDLLPKAEMVFIVSGLGGGVGTVLTPYLTQILRERSSWVWTLATLPFFFEGKAKILNSLRKLQSIQKSANASLVIPHDKIFKLVDKNLSLQDVYTPANDLCAELVTNLANMTFEGGDSRGARIKFSDIKNKLSKKHSTSFGIGKGIGEGRLNIAVEEALTSSLLGKGILNSAEGLIIGITGGEDLSLSEINKAREHLYTLIPREINFNFGVNIDKNCAGMVKVAIVAVGVDAGSAEDSWNLTVTSSTKPQRGIRSSNKEDSNASSSRISRSQRASKKAEQTLINFKKMSKGRFEKSKATVHRGIDLDVPTFLRKRNK